MSTLIDLQIERNKKDGTTDLHLKVEDYPAFVKEIKEDPHMIILFFEKFMIYNSVMFNGALADLGFVKTDNVLKIVD